ncbi:MAG: ATP-dependent DNA helicase RecG [Eubacterium sp.]
MKKNQVYFMNICELEGIGKKTEKIFNSIGIYSGEDLIEYYPRDYELYNKPVLVKDVKNQRICAIEGEVCKKPELKRVRRLNVLSVFICDDEGMSIKATWFNQPYLASKLQIGSRFVFRGKITSNMGMYVLEQPQIYLPDEYNKKIRCMQPIYPLVKGLSNKTVIKSVKQVLDKIEICKDYMPVAVRQKYKLIDEYEAIKKIHFPDNTKDCEQARKRLVFDEFFFFITAMKRVKIDTEALQNQYILKPSHITERLLNNLPYELTNAQNKAWEDIVSDIGSNKVMLRLIQGDVGSGKTIIAILAMVTAAENGYQAALMAPTEILAKQHFNNINDILDESGIDIKTELLTGSMTTKQKDEAYRRIESGEAEIIIGTHALIQDRVTYKNLAMVITDEQHRFGVKQRENLGNKGKVPHTLVMSATPIPRTLAIIIYGETDISIINERPVGRLPIKNCVVGAESRYKAYKFIQSEIRKGHQAYIICPMVEDSEAIEGENVIDYTEKLKKIMPSSIRISYLHGKMKASEKNDIMNRFICREIDILVSTTVIEVGVDVPNATVMMVENAERFGLFALHQLRGRVGRGKDQSYCIFMNGSDKPDANERLEILNKSNDGFFIANEDLRLRGPGDLFGIRQSGDIQFKLGDILTDSDIIKQASEVSDLYLKDKLEYIDDNEKKYLEDVMRKHINKCIQSINL